MANKLELATVKCKLVTHYMRVDEVDIDWWEHWIVFDSFINISEKDIRLIIDGPQTDFNKLHFVPKEQLGRVLNERSLNRYEDACILYKQRENGILFRFKAEASIEMHKLSPELRRFDWVLFKSFNDFGYAPDEELFQKFRTKIIRYDDRILLKQVKQLAEQARKERHRYEKEITIHMIQLVIDCKAVDQETIEKIKKSRDLFNSKLGDITEEELTIFRTNFFKDIFEKREDQQNIKETLLACTNNSITETLERMRGKTVEKFVQNSSAIMYRISEATRLQNLALFESFDELEKYTANFDIYGLNKILRLLDDLQLE